MTPKTLLAALLMISGLSAHAQQQVASGKLFIINAASRPSLISAPNPAAVLAQTDRVELTEGNALVNVKRCGVLGCQDPVGRPVRMDVIQKVNADFRVQDVSDPGGGSPSGCRVCINAKTISNDLQDYVDHVKATASQGQ